MEKLVELIEKQQVVILENSKKIHDLELKEKSRSDSIANLAVALSLAQGQIKEAEKDSDNPFYHSSYADLASVWKACRKPLSDNGLAVIQTLDVNYTLTTTLAHKSGEFIASSLKIAPEKMTPQGIGSAITYARRYSLSAIVGIAPAGEDDDGEAAMSRENKPVNGTTKVTTPTPPMDNPVDKPATPISDKELLSQQVVTKDQVTELRAKAKLKGLTTKDSSNLMEFLKIKSLMELKQGQLKFCNAFIDGNAKLTEEDLLKWKI